MNEPEHTLAYIALGANLGDRRGAISCAIRAIAATPGITVVQVSSLYQTAPVGYIQQPNFLNCAAAIHTTLPPEQLLACCKAIEQQLGRVARGKWQEREIDIDILLYGNLLMTTESLTIPHPELHKRGFVLHPLAEIAAEVIHPQFNKSIAELRRALGDSAKELSIIPDNEFPVGTTRTEIAAHGA